MVRKGSPVRVRKRACENRLVTGGFLWSGGDALAGSAVRAIGGVLGAFSSGRPRSHRPPVPAAGRQPSDHVHVVLGHRRHVVSAAGPGVSAATDSASVSTALPVPGPGGFSV